MEIRHEYKRLHTGHAFLIILPASDQNENHFKRGEKSETTIPEEFGTHSGTRQGVYDLALPNPAWVSYLLYSLIKNLEDSTHLEAFVQGALMEVLFGSGNRVHKKQQPRGECCLAM